LFEALRANSTFDGLWIEKLFATTATFVIVIDNKIWWHTFVEDIPPRPYERFVHQPILWDTVFSSEYPLTTISQCTDEAPSAGCVHPYEVLLGVALRYSDFVRVMPIGLVACQRDVSTTS